MATSGRWCVAAGCLGAMVAMGVWQGGKAGAAEIAVPEQENTCVECHRRAETVREFPAWAQDQFLHWYGAIHGKAGVTCDRCHGGAPAAVTKRAAHKGMRNSRDSRSSVYYKNVPLMCSQCHEEVYHAFAMSDHYKELIADRLAPSCTTCHGFEMDIGAVTPEQMVSRCTVCHNAEQGGKPEVAELAHATLDQIAETRHTLETARVAVDLALEHGIEVENAVTMLKRAERQMDETGVHWHTFRLHAFEGELAGIRRLAEKARTEAMEAIVKK